MMAEGLGRIQSFVKVCAVYYTVQLGWCALVSCTVCVVVIVLRKTFLKDRIFLKGMAWSLLIPTLFVGKLRCFYEIPAEETAPVSGWTILCMNHIWICWLYLCVAALYGLMIFRQRRQVRRFVSRLETRRISGRKVAVSPTPVTPFTVGIMRPRIVVPEVILREYGQDELEMVLLHEKVHISLGHLLCFCLWDILRVLLWINPLLAVSTQLFREDLEEMCDRVTIQKGNISAYEYGCLLLKSVQILRAEGKANGTAAFAGERRYRNIKRRITRIAGYKPYHRAAVVSAAVAVSIGIIGLAFGANSASLARYYPEQSITVYDMAAEEVLAVEETELCYWNEHYIYIDAQTFQQWKGNSEQFDNICVYFGGYSKMPWIGGGGCSAYLRDAEPDGDVWKIQYEEPWDFFSEILKIL